MGLADLERKKMKRGDVDFGQGVHRFVWENFWGAIFMDEIITKILKDNFLRWRIVLILFNAVLSVLFAVITQNIFHTVVFVIISAILDILAEAYDLLKFDLYIKKLFYIKQFKRYFSLVFFACLPTIGAIFLDKISSDSYIIQIFNNLIPNILGALIVSSMFDHIEKFDYNNMISSLIKSKKEMINVFLRISFFASYLNALNYKLNNDWKYMNMSNSIYIFVIVVYGAVAFTTFALRIINPEPFNNKIKSIYPTTTFIYGVLFLVSCGSLQLIVHTREIETILLLFNSLTACVILIGILFLMANRKENKSDIYPIKRILFFILSIVINLLLCFWHWQIDKRVQEQLLSGMIIFAFTVVLFLFVNMKQNGNKIEKSEDAHTVMK